MHIIIRLGLLFVIGLWLAACSGGKGSGDSSGGSGSGSGSGGGAGGGASTSPVTVTDSVEFATQDQGLFGPGKPVKTATLPPIKLQQKTFGPATQGQIFHNVSQEVPLSVLQSAWDQALATCRTTRSFKAVDYCAAYSFTPTQSQCETGSVTLPATATLNCCGSLGVPDTGATYPGCGVLGLKTNATVTIPSNLRNFDLGAGIGPRPTQPAQAPFDVGLVTSYEAHTDVGLELTLTADAGSVDMAYATKASLGASAGSVKAGDSFTITARHQPISDPARTHMESKYPNIGLALQYFVDAAAKVEAEYAHMGADGQQKYAKKTLLSYSTANQPDADAQGRLVGEIFGLQAGLSGVELSIFSNQPSSFPVDFPAGIVWDFPLEFNWDITVPYTCPIDGIPKLGTYVCGPPPPVSTDIVEIGARTPAMDTPAGPNFDGGVVDFASFTPLPVKRNELAADGSLTSTTPSGFRQLLSSSFLGGFNSLDDILLDDGRLSTDFARVDLDLDGLLALYSGGVNPLGTNFNSGVKVINPETGKEEKLLDAEVNMLDIDYANWFHVEQTLKFEPNLVVDLQFDKPVQVRLVGAGTFTTVSTYTLNLVANADATLEVIQPPGGVKITPTYSLRNNRFTNDSNMLWTPALQESVLQVKYEGFLVGLLTSALLGVEPNVAVFQETLSPPPVVMGPIGAAPFNMDGFLDVPGTPVTVGELIN